MRGKKKALGGKKMKLFASKGFPGGNETQVPYCLSGRGTSSEVGKTGSEEEHPGNIHI